MNSTLVNSVIVIIANDVNLSIFNPNWLVKVGIFQEAELSGKILISPVAVQIPTDNFELAIFANRIQFAIQKKYSNVHSDIERVLGGIVTKLPHTPYSGIGLNFDYILAPEDEKTFGLWNKKLFAPKFEDKIKYLQEENARFGSYFSFDILGGRLKIDVKPTRGLSNISNVSKSLHDGQEVVKVNFNFHYDIDKDANPVDFILQVLSKWQDALSLSDQINSMIAG